MILVVYSGKPGDMLYIKGQGSGTAPSSILNIDNTYNEIVDLAELLSEGVI
jgi:hypothetical protein